MKTGAENLQPHMQECAAYGGHDARGGHQKPRGKNSQPAPINQGTMRANTVPPTGPAQAGPMLGSPMMGGTSSGGSKGAGF